MAVGGTILVAVTVVVAVGALALTPFVNLTFGDIPSYLQVSSRTESHLYYPGSALLAVETLGRSGAVPPHSSALLATDATTPSGRVLAWYQDYLTRHGWTQVGAGSFRRSAEIFKVEPWGQRQVRVTYATSGCQLGGTTCFGLIVDSNLPLPLGSAS